MLTFGASQLDGLGAIAAGAGVHLAVPLVILRA
jgi:hypothetical protein